MGNTVTGNRSHRDSSGARLDRQPNPGQHGDRQHPDLVDGNLPPCVNTWQGNTFVTDNEGNGPGAGCIR